LPAKKNFVAGGKNMSRRQVQKGSIVSNELRIVDAQTPPERRPARRRRFLLGGIVVFANGAVSFDCIIRNQSEGGAKLSHAKDVQLPAHFHLINIRDRMVYEAELVWSKDSESGIAFKKRMPLSSIDDPALGYLTHLWLAKAGR
jgi:hypothetical protein